MSDSKSQSTFINNTGSKVLKDRISKLISFSRELKFLVGFFYFSGIRELYDAIRNNPDIVTHVLVGLNVDKQGYGLIEYGAVGKIDGNKHQLLFKDSIIKSINSDEFDTKEFYEQAKFFIQAILDNKLIIKKTREPNHAKLYFFKMKDEHLDLKPCCFITGSSNLTRAGLSHQNEFNVEISDYGNQEAEDYFDELWAKAVKITEDDAFKLELVKLLREATLIAEVTPYEAFAFVLKTYLELHKPKDIKEYVFQLLEKNGYKKYAYQVDAVAQALSIIDKENGVIISDVVGLGKSVIAGMVAKCLYKRGLIICPPALKGGVDDGIRTGWDKYRQDFELNGWEIRSCGLETLRDTLKLVQNENDFEVVIIDEAHRFRNQDTEAYETLSNICRNRIVMLLTATPFNNTPADIFSLLKLFTVPGKSNLILPNNLDERFRQYNQTFRRLSNIKRNHNSSDKKRRDSALADYKSLFGSEKIDLKQVTARAKYLANDIRSVISPVTIRRNRIDLKKDPEYSKEIYELSEVKDPCEAFFALTPEQSEFYDRVISQYFGEGGDFKGTIYRPFEYEAGIVGMDEDELNKDENREALIQKNLYDFMRRLLVKRFESSFGAFRQSIDNFKRITTKVQQFITSSGGKYILDRKLIDQIYQDDEDEIAEELEKFEQMLTYGNYPKHYKVYKLNEKEFKQRAQFLADIDADITLFGKILDELDTLKLVDNDPKLAKLEADLSKILKQKNKATEPTRKVIVFSEYVDTVKYIEAYLEKKFIGQIISVKGDLNKTKATEIMSNFDTTYKNQTNKYQILITTDKMSEGVNLNRAGAVINVDIPWNPTRVVQRVGRINRISKKVFDNLYIYNFFPTIQGASIVRSRQIATEKMFMIHNTLGEDSKVFEVEEIAKADLKDGEEEELVREQTILISSEKLKESCYEAYRAIYGEESSVTAASALELLNQAAVAMNKLAEIDGSMGEQVKHLEQTISGLQDLARDLHIYGDRLEYDPGRMEEIQVHLDLIRNLKRKYGQNIHEILEYAERVQRELEQISHSSERKTELSRRVDSLRKDMAKLAEELSRIRSEAAKKLDGDVIIELRDLNMSGVRFETSVLQETDQSGLAFPGGQRYKFNRDGIDIVEFMVSTNPSEPIKPLAKIASTGEMSRFMLALKSAFSEVDSIPVLIFDEIDIGIGGRSGEIIGKKLRALSRTRQVICVTHLAQIAAYADAHFRITKVLSGNRALSKMERLEGDSMIKEISVMLSGPHPTDKAFSNAQELVQKATEWKKSGA